MSLYINYSWLCETRQSRLLLIGTAHISFIHSFVSSHLGSGKSTTGIHLSSLFSLIYIPFDSLYANANEEEEERKKKRWNNVLFFSFFEYAKKYWSWRSSFSDRWSIGQWRRRKKKKVMRRGRAYKTGLMTNRPQQTSYSSLSIYLKMHPNVSGRDRIKSQRNCRNENITNEMKRCVCIHIQENVIKENSGISAIRIINSNWFYLQQENK